MKVELLSRVVMGHERVEEQSNEPARLVIHQGSGEYMVEHGFGSW